MVEAVKAWPSELSTCGYYGWECQKSYHRPLAHYSTQQKNQPIENNIKIIDYIVLVVKVVFLKSLSSKTVIFVEKLEIFKFA